MTWRGQTPWSINCLSKFVFAVISMSMELSSHEDGELSVLFLCFFFRKKVFKFVHAQICFFTNGLLIFTNGLACMFSIHVWIVFFLRCDVFFCQDYWPYTKNTFLMILSEAQYLYLFGLTQFVFKFCDILWLACLSTQAFVKKRVLCL